jgi:hypothetical protein
MPIAKNPGPQGRRDDQLGKDNAQRNAASRRDRRAKGTR